MLAGPTQNDIGVFDKEIIGFTQVGRCYSQPFTELDDTPYVAAQIL